MELKKRKYKAADVRLMIGAVVSKYEERMNALREKTLEISNENKRLMEELERLKNKESLVLSTLERAEQTASDVKSDIDTQYELEVLRLKNFAKKWNGYFEALKKKYPAYTKTKKAINVIDTFSKIVDQTDAKSVINQIDEMLDEVNPLSKNETNEQAVTEKTNGFDINEVLYPGALKLEDICKELGLIDEE